MKHIQTENGNEKEVTILKPYQNPRSKGTNSRKRKTNPRSKGNNKRVNDFLASVLAIAGIKEQRALNNDEIDQYTQATIDFFVSKYQAEKDNANDKRNN